MPRLTREVKRDGTRSGVVVPARREAGTPVCGQVQREQEVVLHEPQAPRGTIKEDGEPDRPDPGKDRGRGRSNDAPVGQDDHRRDKAYKGDPVVERHGPDEEPLVPLERQPAVGARLVELEPRALPEEAGAAAVGAPVS
jgi:hypothetical protein